MLFNIHSIFKFHQLSPKCPLYNFFPGSSHQQMFSLFKFQTFSVLCNVRIFEVYRPVSYRTLLNLDLSEVSSWVNADDSLLIGSFSEHHIRGQRDLLTVEVVQCFCWVYPPPKALSELTIPHHAYKDVQIWSLLLSSLSSPALSRCAPAILGSPLP